MENEWEGGGVGGGFCDVVVGGVEGRGGVVKMGEEGEIIWLDRNGKPMDGNGY